MKRMMQYGSVIGGNLSPSVLTESELKRSLKLVLLRRRS